MNENQRRHLFLTGEIQVGKSTIIRRFLESVSLPPEQLGGFTTAVRTQTDGSSSVHLVAPGSIGGLDRNNCIMVRYPGNREQRKPPEVFPEVFDARGTELLRNTGGKRLILMDELGFAEQEAVAFKKQVLETLDGEIPVLGVLKKWSSDFLEQVAGHPFVKVIEVDRENRDKIAEQMITFCQIR